MENDHTPNPTYQDYLKAGFIPLLCKGYHPKFNQVRDYNTAKHPTFKGWNEPDYAPPTLQQIETWEKKGGWTGWVIPEDVMFIDAEGQEKLNCIDMILKSRNLSPPIHLTNNGRHYGFLNGNGLTGDSKVFTKSGIEVTFRIGGKNQLILAPTNGRTWERMFSRDSLSPLPDELLLYDRKNLREVLNCLSWQVGVCFRSKSLQGNDDIDLTFMAFLIQSGIGYEDIHKSFALVFLGEYDQRRTDQIFQRTKSKIEEGESIKGAGSFVHLIKGRDDLKLISRFVGELQSLTGHKTPWTDPIPLNEYSSLPAFPVDVLPKIGAEMVKTVSEVNQVDPGLSATIYLSVLATGLSKKAKVDLITHQEPLNLSSCSILPPGERKTGTEAVFSKPIYEFQDERQRELSEKIREALSLYKIEEARLNKVQKKVADSDDYQARKHLEQEALDISKHMAKNPVPKPPMFVCDDITAEALGDRMAENDERMSLFSTEGGIFSIMAGRYNDKGGNFDLYLKGHSGDPWSSHRVGREAKTMQSPALTICLTVQPEVISEIGGNRQFRGRGLLARFLYLKGKPQAGHRKRQLKSIPESLLRRYRDHVFSLMDIPLSDKTLTLSSEAQDVWNEFYEDIENEMGPGGNLEDMKDWGSKLPGAVARIAGLLHFAEQGTAALEIPISVNIAGASCAIGGYYKEHALAVFDFMRLDERIETAKKILNYITTYKSETFKGRDILRHTNLRTMNDITPGLMVLIERGYIREVKTEYSGAGRPEAIAYEINPKMLENH